MKSPKRRDVDVSISRRRGRALEFIRLSGGHEFVTSDTLTGRGFGIGAFSHTGEVFRESVKFPRDVHPTLPRSHTNLWDEHLVVCVWLFGEALEDESVVTYLSLTGEAGCSTSAICFVN